MDFIISLAHFCEFHGPTSILCTQLASVGCNAAGTPQSEDLFKSSLSLKDYWDPASDAVGSVETGGNKQSSLNSPFETPPTSPRVLNGGHNPYFPRVAPPSDGEGVASSRFGQDAAADYDDGCDNCSILVPKNMSDRLPGGAPGSPRTDGKGRYGSPVLRSTQVVPAQGSPCASDSEDSDDGGRSMGGGSHGAAARHHHRGPFARPKLTASPPSEGGSSEGRSGGSSTIHHNNIRVDESAVSSPLSEHPPASSGGGAHHRHTLVYVSTRQPSSPHAYSLLRRACIRTLSTENLPRGSPNGPLYFGDPVAGYTIAYIFRLPDPRARGRRRQYALIALGGRDGWRVSKRYVEVIKAFEAIASTILGMADAVLERESNYSSSAGSISRPGSSASAVAATPSPAKPAANTTTPTPSNATTSPARDRATDGGAAAAKSATTSPVTRTITPVSSFLSAKKLDPDGYPRGAREGAMRPKGLAEIVGREDFFVELHARFCVILSGLVGPA